MGFERERRFILAAIFACLSVGVSPCWSTEPPRDCKDLLAAYDWQGEGPTSEVLWQATLHAKRTELPEPGSALTILRPPQLSALAERLADPTAKRPRLRGERDFAEYIRIADADADKLLEESDLNGSPHEVLEIRIRVKDKTYRSKILRGTASSIKDVLGFSIQEIDRLLEQEVPATAWVDSIEVWHTHPAYAFLEVQKGGKRQIHFPELSPEDIEFVVALSKLYDTIPVHIYAVDASRIVYSAECDAGELDR